MRMLVESLKRLYEAGKLTKEQIEERQESGLITLDEYAYIVGRENADD